MATKIDVEIQKLVESFTTELTQLVRQSIAEAVDEAVEGALGELTTMRRPRAAKKKGATRAAKKARAVRGRARRTAGGFYRRSPEELADLEARLYREIKKKGGRRIEEIAEAMGEDTKTLTLPAKKLIGAKKVKTTGQKRATRYTAA